MIYKALLFVVMICLAGFFWQPLVLAMLITLLVPVLGAAVLLRRFGR